VAIETAKKRNTFTATSLNFGFFMWGLVSAVKATFIPFCFFGFYFIISDQLAMWSISILGLFNSIMFPTLFSLTLFGSGGFTSQCSRLLCLAIEIGAVVLLMQRCLATQIDRQLSFVLPFHCYLYIAYFGVYGFTPRSIIIQSKLSGVLL
jgi:fucose permease